MPRGKGQEVLLLIVFPKKTLDLWLIFFPSDTPFQSAIFSKTTAATI